MSPETKANMYEYSIYDKGCTGKLQGKGGVEKKGCKVNQIK